jgi:hypothetical protein
MIDQLRSRLLPAITIIATGRVIIGKRGDAHSMLVPEGTVNGALPYGPVDVWRRGYWNVHDKCWLDFTAVDGIYADDESVTARTIREMRASP